MGAEEACFYVDSVGMLAVAFVLRLSEEKKEDGVQVAKKLLSSMSRSTIGSLVVVVSIVVP